MIEDEEVAAADVVRARIDSDLKKEASAVLADMGLSVSDAIRLMLVRVVSEKALPFDVRVPNAVTLAAMRDAREGKTERFSSVAGLMAALNDEED
jgi:DNA-damage-inducible protein J